MAKAPSHDESFARLYQAGWTVGDMLTLDRDGDYLWLVIGFKGKKVVRAQAANRDQAWIVASEQAHSSETP